MRHECVVNRIYFNSRLLVGYENHDYSENEVDPHEMSSCRGILDALNQSKHKNIGLVILLMLKVLKIFTVN